MGFHGAGGLKRPSRAYITAIRWQWDSEDRQSPWLTRSSMAGNKYSAWKATNKLVSFHSCNKYLRSVKRERFISLLGASVYVIYPHGVSTVRTKKKEIWPHSQMCKKGFWPIPLSATLAEYPLKSVSFWDLKRRESQFSNRLPPSLPRRLQ